MNKFQKASVSAFIKQNIPFFASVCAALCLYASRSKLVLLAEAGIFAVVAFSAWLNRDTPRKAHGRGPDPVRMPLAVVFTLIGVFSFVGHMKNLLPASLIGWSIFIALIAAAVSFYAFYRLAGGIDGWICNLLPSDAAHHGFRGRVGNLFFPVSYAAFFVLDGRLNTNASYLFSVLAGAGIAVMIASRAGSLWHFCRKDSPAWVVFCGLTAVGVCRFQQKSWTAAAPEYGPAGILLAIGAFFFVFVCVSGFWRWLRQSLRGVFSDVTRGEWAFCGGLLLVLLAAVTVVFLGTDAFYETAYPYDIVYTSDSHILVQDNAYLWISNEENDLRQPLFAVFSAPFLGLSYLIGSLFSVPAPVNALLMNYPQILLLFLANFLLARMLGGHGWKRSGIFLLLTSAYPALLFSFMMEQYIAAYFYLVLFLYSLWAGKPDAVAFCGAGGSLLTSVITVPLTSKKDPRADLKGWFQDVLNGGFGFVIFLLAFSRLDIILNAANSLLDLKRFAGEALSLGEKLCQYTAFVSGCLWAPAAEVTENMWGNLSWQLVPAQHLNRAGIGILLLCLVSVVLNRRDKLTRLAGAWLAFSVLVLLVVGWGTQENGLILYGLYFGWAVLVLLYRLAAWAGAKLSAPNLAGLFSVIGGTVLLAVNASAMAALIAFAMEAYPL